MGRLVTLSRSGIVKETSLAPSTTRKKPGPQPVPLTPQELEIARRGQEDFVFFLEKVFPLSFEGQMFLQADNTHRPFALGDFHRVLARTIQEELESGGRSRFSFMAPRLHLKSTVLNYGFTFWQLFRGYRTGGRDWLTAEDIDGLVISYKDDLAGDHIRNTKRLIEANPLTRLWKDRKPQAEAVMSYDVDFGLGHSWLAELRGSGILSAARGKHPKFVVVDDPLSDFANPAETSELEHIDRVFRQVILSLPRRGDPLIVIGTPQAEDDLLHKLADNESFIWQRHPAVKDEATREVLWPEVFSYEVLEQKRKEVGEKAFLVEYMLVPLRSLDGYFNREEIEACVAPEMESWPLDEHFPAEQCEGVYAGIDIGRESHPTHISVLAVYEGWLIQVYERFLDNVDYNTQVRIINQLVEHYKINRVYYDATRGEMADRGLSRVVHGVKFSKSNKVAMAQALERYVRGNPDLDEPRLLLLGPTTSRQVNSILAVNRELKARTSQGDHGDAFWSNALAVKAAEEGPTMQVMVDVGAMFSAQHRLRWGTNPLGGPKWFRPHGGFL
jgi:hypothetical protein